MVSVDGKRIQGENAQVRWYRNPRRMAWRQGIQFSSIQSRLLISLT